MEDFIKIGTATGVNEQLQWPILKMTPHTIQCLRNPVLKNRRLSASDLAEGLSVEIGASGSEQTGHSIQSASASKKKQNGPNVQD